MRLKQPPLLHLTPPPPPAGPLLSNPIREGVASSCSTTTTMHDSAVWCYLASTLLLCDAGEVDLHADAAPWWLLQRCLLLEQLDALETFMALVDRSAHNKKPLLPG